MFWMFYAMGFWKSLVDSVRIDLCDLETIINCLLLDLMELVNLSLLSGCHLSQYSSAVLPQSYLPHRLVRTGPYTT